MSVCPSFRTLHSSHGVRARTRSQHYCQCFVRIIVILVAWPFLFATATTLCCMSASLSVCFSSLINNNNNNNKGKSTITNSILTFYERKGPLCPPHILLESKTTEDCVQAKSPKSPTNIHNGFNSKSINVKIGIK